MTGLPAQTDATFEFWLRARMVDGMPQPQRYGKTVVGVSCARCGCPVWMWLTMVLPLTVWETQRSTTDVTAVRVGKRFITIQGKRHQMTPRLRAFVAKVDQLKGAEVRTAQALEMWQATA